MHSFWAIGMGAQTDRDRREDRLLRALTSRFLCVPRWLSHFCICDAHTMLPETSQGIYRAAIAGRGTWLGSVGGLGMILPIAYPLVWVGSSQQLVGVIRFAFSYDKLTHVSLCFLYLLFFICYSPIPFHSIVLFQATRPIHTKQRLGKNTENQYKEKG